MKRPPSPKMCELRSKLQRLATEGIGGERTNAKARLERLEARIDFAIQIIAPGDIFANAVKPSSDFLRLAEFQEPAGSFVKWAVERGYGVETRWRGAALHAGVSARSIPALMKAALHIAASFETLWQAFRALPGATDADARTFLLGLHDGCMDCERERGEILPTRRIEAVKTNPGRRKRGAVVVAPGLSIHPYEAALPLGRRIRLSAPVADLEADLMDAERRARLHAMPA